MKLLRHGVVGVVVLLALPALAGSGFDKEIFEAWIAARLGTGEPVYWYSIGEVYSYPDGKKIAILEGVDTGRVHRSEEDPNLAFQLSRKTYVYRDPASGEILREVDGQPVKHIEYPYQFISYQLDGEQLITWVEQGSGESKRRIGPGTDISARKMGDMLVFSAPVFLDFDTPAGRYQSFEHYDFLIRTDNSAAEPKHQVSWVRYGPLPAWAGEGRAGVHLITTRYDSFSELPASIREYIEKDAPLWKAPPKDVAEIRTLQAGDPKE